MKLKDIGTFRGQGKETGVCYRVGVHYPWQAVNQLRARSRVLWAFVPILALAPAVARGDIYVTHGPDGSLHFTNVSSHRGPSARLFIRSRDAPAHQSSTSQVVSAEGAPEGSVPQSANVRTLFAAVAR